MALSADDTKLLDAFSLFYDRQSGSWFIVGGAGEPLLITDPDSFEEELARAKLEKATKVSNLVGVASPNRLCLVELLVPLQVRVWCIIVPLPRIPPIVLAAMAITDRVTAEELTRYTHRIIDGLHEKDIWPVSYACDGNDTERANQRNLASQAHGIDARIIRSPSPLVEDIKVNIPIYHGRPLALLQDSLHAKKTARNNIGSGARTLVLGNHCALYDGLRDMAFHEKSPLYHRDVENTDKQDDRAAARVHSSRAIEWLIEHRPDNLGLIIFLFVFGEFIDVFQCRHASFNERFQMFFRCYFFIELWKVVLVDSKYALNKYGLSPDARDIFSILGHGFLQLVFIYRDFISDKRIPLLLWLHSSEICEHVFAEVRKLSKDFNFSDFLFLMPKVHCPIRNSMGLGGMSTSDAKDRASGYAHTWMDLDDLSLANLRTFPSDIEIAELAREGFEDASDLWQQLGVFIGNVHIPKQSESCGRFSMYPHFANAASISHDRKRRQG